LFGNMESDLWIFGGLLFFYVSSTQLFFAFIYDDLFETYLLLIYSGLGP
jgi:hypothetical protein